MHTSCALALLAGGLHLALALGDVPAGLYTSQMGYVAKLGDLNTWRVSRGAICSQPHLLRMRGGGGSPVKIKLTYFNIEGAAEKVRLALKIGGIQFEDERIDFATWPSVKEKTPFGQLPIMTIDDKAVHAQSGAMLHFAGRLGGLYPTDPVQALRVDELVGLQEDLAKALTPSYMVGMRPHLLGHAENLPEEEKKAIQLKLRQALIAENGDLHRYLGYFENALKQNGSGFLHGTTPTIADCALLAQLRALKSGRLDGIPTTITDKYHLVTAFYTKMMALPAVKAHYGA